MFRHSAHVLILAVALLIALPTGGAAQDEKGKKKESPASLEELMEQLDSKNAKERNRARRFIWKNVTPGDLSVLFENVMQTDNPKVGDPLIEAIRRIKTRDAGRALIKLSLDHDLPHIRHSAVIALLQLRDPRARELILKWVRSEEKPTEEKVNLLDRVRYHARFRLREELRKMLSNEISDQPALEQSILKILLQNDNSSNVPVFKSYFESDETELKQLAAFGLYKLGSDASVPYLKKTLKSGELARGLARKVVRLVKRREDEKFRTTFIEMLKSEPEKLRINAGLLIQILGSIGQSDDIEVLGKLQEDLPEKRRGWKRSLTRAILNIASRTDINTLIDMLESHESAERRVLAALLLFRMDRDRGERALINFLKRDGTNIRKRALRAFAHRNVLIYRSIPILFDLLENGEKEHLKLTLRALKNQIFTFFPYHPFDFSKFEYEPGKNPEQRKKLVQVLRKWWDKWGGETPPAKDK